MRPHQRPWTGIVSRLASAIKDSRTRRGTIHDLRRMNDLQLADIGIERRRIPEMVDALMSRNAARRENHEYDRGGHHVSFVAFWPRFPKRLRLH